MKKIFSIIATAIAFGMTLTSCDDEDTFTDLLDGDHLVETQIHAEITGGFTKAFAFKVGYTDFDGNTDTVLVNGNFDGEKATFDKKFQTKVSDDNKEASVKIKTLLGEVENYKAELSPYAVKYSVIVKLDGKNYYNYDRDDDVVTESGLPVYDDEVDYNIIDWAKRAFGHFDNMFGENGTKDLVISVGRKGINFEVK